MSILNTIWSRPDLDGAAHRRIPAMPPCRFSFDDGPTFPGFSHGSTWNGFDNVAVTPETHAEVLAWLEREGGDADEIEGFRAMVPDASGLISYGGGYATRIER